MKKLLCGILCLLMLLGCASAEGYWYAAKGDNGLWGHIDELSLIHISEPTRRS